MTGWMGGEIWYFISRLYSPTFIIEGGYSNDILSHMHPQLTDHLIMPLFSMVGELCRRQSELIKLLGRKDREIQDYKDHGATVSRRA